MPETNREHPRIKVCGVTTEDDLRGLATTNVDTVGLNFVPSSPRCLSLEQGLALAGLASELELATVAVVMNLESAELESLCHQLPVDFVQLHGRETPQVSEHCAGLPIVKAISWSGREEERELAAAWGDAARAGQLSSKLAAFLVDAYAPVTGGGTGKKARWDLLVPRPEELEGVPLLLAGGIRADNVAEGILQTQPDGVDTASGVELAPGVKDIAACSLFASNAVATWS